MTNIIVVQVQLQLDFVRFMTTPPGCVGWPITGDRTFEFAKNPNEFIKHRIKSNGSRVFQVRALNKPHVFVASNQGVKEILEGNL